MNINALSEASHGSLSAMCLARLCKALDAKKRSGVSDIMRSGIRNPLALTIAVLFAVLTSLDARPIKTDECPHIILAVACDSHKNERCCSTYIAEAAGQWGTDIKKIGFNWHVSNGKIVEGQGTAVIRIDTKQAKGKPIEIKVQVDGLNAWHPICPKALSIRLDRCKDKEKSTST